MNSFTLTAIGNLARNPEAIAKGDTLYTRFCLVGNDYAGKDDEGQPREIITSIWFVAFGATADSIVRNARKGDQVFVEARVRSNVWTDKQGEKQHNHEFVVQGFRFGAPGRLKREEREARRGDLSHRGNARSNGRDNGYDDGSHGGDAGEGHLTANGAARNKGADVGGHANNEARAKGDTGTSVYGGAEVTKVAGTPSEPLSNIRTARAAADPPLDAKVDPGNAGTRTGETGSKPAVSADAGTAASEPGDDKAALDTVAASNAGDTNSPNGASEASDAKAALTTTAASNADGTNASNGISATGKAGTSAGDTDSKAATSAGVRTGAGAASGTNEADVAAGTDTAHAANATTGSNAPSGTNSASAPDTATRSKAPPAAKPTKSSNSTEKPATNRSGRRAIAPPP